MYLVLARKLRPQTFEEVIGQRHVTQTLQNAITQNRLAHALIFSGPRGVGKTSIARILAKAVNCQKGPTPTPCNVCESCTAITAGNFADVMEIDGASNRGIDEIRSLRENCRFRPVAGRFRVYIIDEIHMLTKEAFNALLKTLEEPPEHVFFILATTEPHKIPATIHSRCQHYEFRRIHIQDLADYLNQIVTKEGLGLNKDCTLLIAREADGSVRDSLSLLDQAAAYGVRTAEEMCEAFGLLNSQILERICTALLQKDVGTVFTLMHELHLRGVEPKAFALQLMEYMRDLLILRMIGLETGKNIVKLSQDEAARIWPMIQTMPATLAIQILDLLVKGMSGLQFSQSPAIALEILLTRIAMLQESIDITQLISRIDGLLTGAECPKPAATPARSASNGHATVQSPVHASAPPQKEGPASTKQASDRNAADQLVPGSTHATAIIETDTASETSVTPQPAKDVMGFLRQKRPDLASLMDDCNIHQQDDCVILTFKSTIHGDIIKSETNLDTLTKLFETFYGKPQQIQIKIHHNTEREDSNQSTLTGQPINEELKNMPLVQEILRVFDARIEAVYPHHKPRRSKKA
ncbi:MAG: DNA polymerase III subunit gamma/tau [Dissulfuribacterales bacterium]